MSGLRESIWKLTKEELAQVAWELNLTVATDDKIADLRHLIENSDIYKNKPEFMQQVINFVSEEWHEVEAVRQESKSELEIVRTKIAEKEKELHRVRMQRCLQAIKNRVPKSHSNLELEFQGTNENCVDPLNFPEEIDSEHLLKESGEQKQILTTAGQDPLEPPLEKGEFMTKKTDYGKGSTAVKDVRGVIGASCQGGDEKNKWVEEARENCELNKEIFEKEFYDHKTAEGKLNFVEEIVSETVGTGLNGDCFDFSEENVVSEPVATGLKGGSFDFAGNLCSVGASVIGELGFSSRCVEDGNDDAFDLGTRVVVVEVRSYLEVSSEKNECEATSFLEIGRFKRLIWRAHLPRITKDKPNIVTWEPNSGKSKMSYRVFEKWKEKDFFTYIHSASLLHNSGNCDSSELLQNCNSTEWTVDRR